MSVQVSIIIVTYNSEEVIEPCIGSLIDMGKPDALQIIVVDNLSGDHTIEIIRKRFPQVELIVSPVNGGYSAGINQGLKIATGDYCFVLNPDVKAHKGCTDFLVNVLENNLNAGCAGPAIIDEHGEVILSHYPFQKLGMSLWIALGLQRIIPLNKTDHKWEIRTKPPLEQVEVDRLLGAAIMFRKSALEQIGGFDERFFLYSEEEDVCYRINQAGSTILYCPDASATHIGAVSTGTNNPLAVASANWSRFMFIKKHFSGASAEISRCIWIIMLSFRYLISLVIGSKMSKAYIMSIKSLWLPGYFENILRPPRMIRSEIETAHR